MFTTQLIGYNFVFLRLFWSKYCSVKYFMNLMSAIANIIQPL